MNLLAWKVETNEGLPLLATLNRYTFNMGSKSLTSMDDAD